MTPGFRILAGGTDITAAIRDRLIEITVTDVAGIESDTLKLKIDDRRLEGGGIAALPTIGTRMVVSMGYVETGLMKMGQYLVDEIECFSPPATMIVTAHAAEMSAPIRAPRTRSFDDVTIGSLATLIAAEHGLTSAVSADLAEVALGHIDQTAESDLALLTRIALAHDALFKVAGGKLIFARRGAAISTSGAPMPKVALAVDQIIEWRFRHSARRPGGQGKPDHPTDGASPQIASGGVKAYYWDFDAGERKEVTVGKPPYSEIRHVHVSKEKALAAARSALSTGERGQGELALTIVGDARIVAEAMVEVALRPGVPTRWVVQRAEHQIGPQGFITQIDCVLPDAPTKTTNR